MMQLIEGDFLGTQVGELPRMTKVHCFVDKIEKYVLVLGYVDETLFERKYWENCPFGKALSTNLMHFYDLG